MAMDSLTNDVGRVAGEVMELFIESVVARVVVTPVAWSPESHFSAVTSSQKFGLATSCSVLQPPALYTCQWR